MSARALAAEAEEDSGHPRPRDGIKNWCLAFNQSVWHVAAHCLKGRAKEQKRQFLARQ